MSRASNGMVWVAVLMLTSCKSAAPEPQTDSPAAFAESEPEPEPSGSPPTDAAQAGQIACHLDCSGQERTAYGADEDQARAAAQALVADTCRPEDGQFFIVCDPPAGE